MQSGKTDTFLLTAFECLRLNRVKHVILFTGNNDLMLKQQMLSSIEQFSYKYLSYLHEHDDTMAMAKTIDPLVWFNQFKQWQASIQVLWPSGLKPAAKATDTLFIWEESHYAQSVNMLPFDFLNHHGIPTTGGDEMLARNNNFMLSVSATPFSEYATALLNHQDKTIVYLKPTEQYYGIPYFHAHQLIQPHNNNDSHDFARAILSCEKRFPGEKKYGIVRIQDSQTEETFRRMAEKHGWICKHYNMTVRDIDIHFTKEPRENTIVFIKGALRMGQQVNKRFIGFCWESSLHSNTDTLLQSLLGRLCSFDESVTRICTYIPQTIVESGEIQRYVDFMNCIATGDTAVALTVMPRNAMNIRVSVSNSNVLMEKNMNVCYEPGVPLYIPAKLLSQPLISSLRTIMNDVASYPDLVGISQTDASVMTQKMSEKTTTHNWSGVSYRSKMKKMVDAYISRQSFKSSSHLDAVHVWKVDVVHPDFPQFQPGDVFLEVFRPIVNTNPTNILSIDKDTAFIQPPPKI